MILRIQLTCIQGGFTHAFVLEIENSEDRDYFVFEDAVHLKFVAESKEVVARVHIVDFDTHTF